jgi:hypothetical protein
MKFTNTQKARKKKKEKTNSKKRAGEFWRAGRRWMFNVLDRLKKRGRLSFELEVETLLLY